MAASASTNLSSDLDNLMLADNDDGNESTDNSMSGNQQAHDKFAAAVRLLGKKYVQVLPALEPIKGALLSRNDQNELQIVQNLQLLIQQAMKLHTETLGNDENPTMGALNTLCQLMVITCCVSMDKLLSFYMCVYMCVYTCVCFYIYIEKHREHINLFSNKG